MAILSQLVFLQRTKEELIDKLNDPTTSYSEYKELTNRLRMMNREINELRGIALRTTKSIG